MINLIPPTAKRVMVREYWMRVAYVWSLLLCTTLVLVATFLVPSFVLVGSQLAAYESQIVEAEAMASEQAALVATVEEANQQATHLNAVAEIVPTQSYINRIDALAGSNIKLTQISISRTELLVSTVLVSGVATTRENLARFRDALLAAEEFTAADLPLASLAANSDNIFTITLTVTPPR